MFFILNILKFSGDYMIKEEKIFYDSTDNIKLCGLLSVVNKSDKILILSHGLNSYKERISFNKFIEKAQTQNINTFRFDFRAHGESTGIDYEMTLLKEVQDLEATLKMLNNRGYNNISILGSCLGVSVFSLIDFNKYKYIKALISWYGALDNLSITNQDWYFTIKHKKEIEIKGFLEITSRRTGKVFKLGKGLYNEVCSLVSYENLVKLDLPILFIHGLNDMMIPFELSEKVSKLCKNSKLALIENASHNFANNDEAQNKAIDVSLDFVKGVFI